MSDNQADSPAAPAKRRNPRAGRKPAAKAVDKPKLIAGIDIGSTAVRLNISQLEPEGPPRRIEELNYPVTTGADTFRHGRIMPETIQAICRILKNFADLMDDYEVQYRRVVSTSAVREASNNEIIIDRVRLEAGLNLEILDAVEESRLAYQALLPWLRETPGSYSLALNLGGGSTEIMLLRGEDLQIGGTRRLGTSRLFHAIGRGDSQGKREVLETITTNIVNSTREVYQEYHAARFLLINRMLYRAFITDPAAVRHDNDFVINAETLRERLTRYSTMGTLELGQHFNMGLADIELLDPAMLILFSFLEATEVREITFTNTEMLSGLLLEMAMAARGEKPLMSFHRQIVRSARAVGEKFSYDRVHSRLVTDFSLKIFAALAESLELDDHDRLLLEVAAVLHDVGMYVAERRHHRHSAYLIKWSDIVGLNEADRNMAAQIAYFHRKETPSRSHDEFMALSFDNRMRVRKLSAILRLADVLDRGHRQQVKDLAVELSEDKLILHAQVVGDMGVVMDALPGKADLIEDVTGLQVVIRRELPKAQ